MACFFPSCKDICLHNIKGIKYCLYGYALSALTMEVEHELKETAKNTAPSDAAMARR